jgi:hypothetical protein
LASTASQPCVQNDKTEYLTTEEYRVLAFMNDNYELNVMDTLSYDSEEPIVDNTNEFYNMQARLYDLGITYNESWDDVSENNFFPKYYVRKFVVDKNSNEQCQSFDITIPGITSILNKENADVEVWMFKKNELTNGRRVDLENTQIAANNFEGVARNITNNTISILNTLEFNNNDEIYIAIKINTVNGYKKIKVKSGSTLTPIKITN